MSEKPTQIRLFGTQEDSIVDGPGLRFAIFTQGCDQACPGCHNPESQPREGGYVVSIDELVKTITENRIIQGVTFTGGEPFLQAGACLEIAQRLKEEGINLWIYSGFFYEDIIEGTFGAEAIELLSLCDVLVDGPYVEKLHAYDVVWRGSTNQRIIDLKKSEARGEAVLWESYDEYPSKPPSW